MAPCHVKAAILSHGHNLTHIEPGGFKVQRGTGAQGGYVFPLVDKPALIHGNVLENCHKMM